MSDFEIRQAQDRDIDNLCALIFEHGPNPWNHLPQDEVAAHLQGIAAGAVQALLAEREGELLGFVSYRQSRDFARYQPAPRRAQVHAYICEAVTHRDMAGQGLGSHLLRQVVSLLAEQGLHDIYIERHEENAASAGMMRKAGFVEIESYADPDRRPHGSGRTTVCCLRMPQDG
ncbi:GNAT family N-acetyltransferase [Pseudomonas sp. SA3-5]|uniref:GNAT family N-acetyltransferase n=1 Tax=Pseudomonas aestuarii TaxID=3018340 RepID=A0ABT4XK95_9PSED|nr:GNAT family N-acetyltransferase [Pseudomonas aestuarii]MDA7088639.1 GNAT family N-acetyltransferase [Pseudomonas aestuarii]